MKPGVYLIYDLESLPDVSGNEDTGSHLEVILDYFKKEQVLLWDSSKDGVEPKILTDQESAPTMKLLDVESMEREEIQKLLDRK